MTDAPTAAPAPVAEPAVDDPAAPRRRGRGPAAWWAAARRDPWTAAAWLLLVVATGWMLWHTARHDFRTQPLVADQAAQLLQGLSLAHDGNDLSYDALDVQRWRDVGWTTNPNGLYYQAFEGGWAFAKPYLYSVLLVVPYRLFGPAVGVALTNSALLLALVGLSVAILRLWLRGPAVPLVAGAFVFASNAYFHAYPVVVDLFLAVGTAGFAYLVLRGLRDGDHRWTVAGLVVGAVLLSEKSPMALALGPLALVAWARLPGWRWKSAGAAVPLVLLALAVVPYLHYSDGASWSAYGGERYYAYSNVPFDPDADFASTPEPLRVPTDETVSLDYVGDQLTSGWADTAQSAVYYVVGRHTGLVVSAPMALAVIGLALWRVRRLPAEALAPLAGIGLYVAFYLVLFADNYYGGGQAVGNRYFLQIAPLVLAVAAAGRLPTRPLAGMALASVALSLVLWWPHHANPQEALVELDRTTPAQDLLPFEVNQLGADYWRCGVGYCADDGG